MVVVKFPRRQLTFVGDAALDFDDASGTEIRPSEFFLAGPYYFDGTTGSARQTSRLDSGIAGVLPAVRRARIGHNHAHAALRQMENSRELVAVGEWPLRASPHREFPIGPLSHGRARLQRSMCDVCNSVGCVEPMRGACQPLFHGTFLLSETVLGLGGPVLLEIRKKFLIGNLWKLFPFRVYGL